jgi:hypothetical protein
VCLPRVSHRFVVVVVDDDSCVVRSALEMGEFDEDVGTRVVFFLEFSNLKTQLL